ncbi:hypothetical protein BWQ96_10159 [Gracilariopsis chorda]|uniref:NB-ARC domain-containing protein n=1 Tax=Gracilariopsis chorda TaxID=448386 RepID=A0A2V3IDJ4_9FLOR|nr:hypothetical protein BWQ96_10159 [Gracilariopsis chorda]|eukprot:PXF40121.1 hypothetical protein BWQ96_10159 [Gracilariopsis chorda]
MHSSERFIAVIASGRGGVRKTCPLRGLRSNVEIRLRFPDGVVFLSLGPDADIETLIHVVSKIVKNTGDHKPGKKIHSAPHLQEAVELARVWFRARRCLFLVDDLWDANGIDGNVLYILSEIMDDGSRLVFSTRDDVLAKEAETNIPFEAKEPRGREARQVLQAGLEETVILDKKSEDALNDILRVCGGVLLRLGAAAAGVREYTRLVTGPHEDALSRYNNDLKNSQTSLVRQEVLQYGPVRNVVDASLHVLQKRWDHEQHEWCAMSIREMHLSLCILKKQQVAPLLMLQRLWDIKKADTNRVVEVMKTLNDVGVVELQYRSDLEKNFPQLKVHDDILDILVCDADDSGSRHLHIWRLLGNYCPLELNEENVEEEVEEKSAQNNIQKRSKLGWLCC